VALIAYLATFSALGTGDETTLLAWSLLAAAVAAAGAVKDTCLECHSALEGPLRAPAAGFSSDIHAAMASVAPTATGRPRDGRHGGIHEPARGFVGKPARAAIPRLCARCHSDANLMHKYSPQKRVDSMRST